MLIEGVVQVSEEGTPQGEPLVRWCGRVAGRNPCHPTRSGVLPRHLLGNRLLADVAVQHYVLGVTLGQLGSQLRVGHGTFMGASHLLAGRFEPLLEWWVRDSRRAPVKHADKTGWRTDERNGCAWLYGPDAISLFRFRGSCSAQIAQQVLGTGDGGCPGSGPLPRP